MQNHPWYIFNYSIISLSMLFIFSACKPSPRLNLEEVALIPAVQKLVSRSEDSFMINSRTAIKIIGEAEEMPILAQYLADLLKPATAFNWPILIPSDEREENIIELSISSGDSLPPEGYIIEIGAKKVSLKAADPAGLFYSFQTLRQLLPAQIEEEEVQKVYWPLAQGRIEDYPSYSHRGMMLDVSRHFFGVEDVKRLIEQMAAYKLNVLHLHLADDQGWRIEIKSWPRLSEYGGSTEVGGGKGGYYTQDDFLEIVQYAKQHYIEVIPEIDMPGHTNAALASYPALNCDSKAPELYTGTEVGFSSLCIDKDSTYIFVEDVLREISAISPSPYIHIGGDESHATDSLDYIRFINRVKGIVEKYDKKMIGWDEISAAEIDSNTVAQFWANADNAVKAAKKGAKIILSPAKKVYLDMQYDSTSTLGLHWAAYVEVDSAYLWNIENYVPGLKKEQILGIESPLWTETIESREDIEYMVFPRLMGHAELSWTAPSNPDWANYRDRLALFAERLKIQGINFYSSKLIPWEKPE